MRRVSLIFLISQPVRDFCRNELAGEIEFILTIGGDVANMGRTTLTWHMMARLE